MVKTHMVDTKLVDKKRNLNNISQDNKQKMNYIPLNQQYKIESQHRFKLNYVRPTSSHTKRVTNFENKKNFPSKSRIYTHIVPF